MSHAMAVEQCQHHDACMLEHEHRVYNVKRDVDTVKDTVATIRKDQGQINIELYGGAKEKGLIHAVRENTDAINKFNGVVKKVAWSSVTIAGSCIIGLITLVGKFVWSAIGSQTLANFSRAIGF